MPQFLDQRDADFDAALTRLLDRAGERDMAVDQAVTGIIADVRERGLDAVLDYTLRFDRIELTEETLAFSAADMDAAIASVPAEDRTALELAASRIRAYHKRQRPDDALWTDATGASLGWRWTPVGAAGLYVPGGSASYPSSVLMNAIPAQVAGVERMVICAPTPDGRVNPLVLLAARLAGVETVYRIGGAQAIAALAFGAGPIAPVDKITGPGNAYVAAAKRQVFGQTGIDLIAGPSEVLIIADGLNDPEWIALDLLAQAEHDEDAQSILVTDDAAFGRAVAEAVEQQLQILERRAIAETSWQRRGAIITVAALEDAVAIADRIAPEHLQICTNDPELLSARIRNAGAIFLGTATPEAIGDYVAGPNHVLPTAGSARFSSGLSVLDFMKRTTISGMTREALQALEPAAERIAQAEGLTAHALSIRARLAGAG